MDTNDTISDLDGVELLPVTVDRIDQLLQMAMHDGKFGSGLRELSLAQLSKLEKKLCDKMHQEISVEEYLCLMNRCRTKLKMSPIKILLSNIRSEIIPDQLDLVRNKFWFLRGLLDDVRNQIRRKESKRSGKLPS